MNIFRTFFGKSNHSNNSDSEGDINVMEDLFIDNQPPHQEETVEVSRTKNGISRFLEQDFSGMGYQDGYVHHSGEVLENKIRQIKADFRYELDLVIDEKTNHKLQLSQMMNEAGNVSEKLNKQTESMIRDLQEKIDQYNQEKINSVEDDGWVMRAVYRYREGFTKGMARYQQEKMMGISTGMFH